MSYDHLAAGTGEAVWQPVVDALPALTWRPLPLVALAAHPDDETLGAGGLIAATARAGLSVTVIVASAGEASHPRSPTHTSAELAARRRLELHAAVRELAPTADVRWLDLPDGSIADHPTELRAALREYADGSRIAAPYRDDRHPDHDACGRAAADVAEDLGIELLEYPIWFWHWAKPGMLPATWRRLPLPSEGCEAKRRALRCHVSQHLPLSDRPGDEAILSPGIVAHFERPFETFAVTAAASSTSYFDKLYEGFETDPWGLDDRWYERRKRDLVLAALPRERFVRIFEPGAATGALTARLRERSDEVVAWEQSAEARRRSHDPDVAAGRIPDEWPDGEFDLIVLSEVGYYCPDPGALVIRVEASLADDGVLVACHWRHAAADHAHTGDEVHDALAALPLHRDVHHVEADFVLDVWSRHGRSVARRDGIM